MSLESKRLAGLKGNITRLTNLYNAGEISLSDYEISVEKTQSKIEAITGSTYTPTPTPASSEITDRQLRHKIGGIKGEITKLKKKYKELYNANQETSFEATELKRKLESYNKQLEQLQEFRETGNYQSFENALKIAKAQKQYNKRNRSRKAFSAKELAEFFEANLLSSYIWQIMTPADRASANKIIADIVIKLVKLQETAGREYVESYYVRNTVELIHTSVSGSEFIHGLIQIDREIESELAQSDEIHGFTDDEWEEVDPDDVMDWY